MVRQQPSHTWMKRSANEGLQAVCSTNTRSFSSDIILHNFSSDISLHVPGDAAVVGQNAWYGQHTLTHTHTHTHTQTNTHTPHTHRTHTQTHTQTSRHNTFKLHSGKLLHRHRTMPQRNTHTHTHTYTHANPKYLAHIGLIKRSASRGGSLKLVGILRRRRACSSARSPALSAACARASVVSTSCFNTTFYYSKRSS